MNSRTGACTTVGQGGVGESGASSFLVHTVGGSISKMMVLRNVQSSLCQNTGAVAMLVVNGRPAASGNITAVGNTIQTEASPGDRVAAVVHTIPLFNGVLCARLGELDYVLDECDLVTAAARTADATTPTGHCVPSRDWYAWINAMPPKPNVFHVVGEVQVPNPGVDCLLTPRNPQGINPRILLLDLHLIQQPGLWTQILTWKPARFDKVKGDYDQVQIYCGNEVIADVPVDVIH